MVEKNDEAFEELRPYRDLDASRLKIVGRGQWDCCDFLPDLFYMVFKEPRINVFDLPFRKDEVPDNTRNSHEEMLALCRLWDAQGLLRLIPTELGPSRIEMCTKVFNNYKNTLADRQIGDRRGANSQEGRVPGPSKSLPSATALLQLSVRRWEEALIGSITDRRDFYHQFHVTWEKSSLNAIYPWPRLSELKGLEAATAYLENFGKKALRRKKDRETEGDFLGGKRPTLLVSEDPYVVPCFAALFQGDHMGVEVATASHTGLLQEYGLLVSGSRLLSTSFVVQDEVVDGLVIDDYFVLSREDVRAVNGEGCCPSSKSVEKLMVAKGAYKREKIEGSDDKDVLGASVFKVVGGEVNSSLSSVARGNVPVGAPAQKRWSLAMLSAAAAVLPCTTDSLHGSLLGSWISVLLYRRPLISIISELFKVIPASELNTEEPRTWHLSRSAAEELLLLAVMSPVMSSNLAIPFDNEVLATDASMAMGGICPTEVSEEVSALLWRSSDVKGENVPLMRSSEALLHCYDIDFEEERKEKDYIEEGEGEEEQCCDRPIGQRFDFIEVCGGAGAVTAHLSRLGVVCAAVFDISTSAQYDVTALRVCQWIVYMLEDGRLLAFLVAPPCTTYSPAAFPALRSYQVPMGYDLTNPRVLLGNTLAFRCILLLQVAKRTGGFGAIEQPLRSKMRWLPHWRRMMRLGAKEVHLASCAFGSPHEKKFCFMSINMSMEPLRRKCSRDHTHVRIQGKFTKPSATYTKGLAIALAKNFRDHIVARKITLEQCDLDVAGLEDVISNDILSSFEWEEQDSWSWKGSSHINLLEASAICRAYGKKALSGGDRRFVYFCDSHVARASCARGRTSSDGMRPILKRISSTSVAYGLYGHGRFAPTRINPADAPTRRYKIPPPVPSSVLRGKEAEEVAWILRLPRVRRWAANWMRLVLLWSPSLSQFHASRESKRVLSRFPLSGPEILSNFDSSLGYPGEGPILLLVISAASWIFALCSLRPSLITTSPARRPYQLLWLACLLGCFWHASATGARGSHGDDLRKAARAGIELPQGRRVTELTSSNRQVFLSKFLGWLENEGLDSRTVFEGPPDIDQINRWISDYGRKLFREGKPYYQYSETINAISAKRPTLRRSLMQAWDLAFMWNSYEPVEHHVAMPHQVLLALLSICMMWGWVREASCFALCFGALLRSGELLAAVRGDLIFPQDVGGTLDHILIRILEPKTRFRAARHQASKVEQADLIRVISLGLYQLRPNEALWPLSGSSLRGRLTKAFERLGLPTNPGSRPKALTLASFRAGGATWLISKSESVELTRRRGRWVSLKVLETYLQEVAASTYLNEVSDESKELILAAMSSFVSILETSERLTRGCIPKATWFLLFVKAFGQRQTGQDGWNG